MNRRFSVDFAILAMALDAIVILTTINIATVIRPNLSYLPFVKNMPMVIELPPILYFALPLIWIIILYTLSIYDGKRNIRLVDEISTLTFGSFIAFIGQAGLLYLTYREISRFLFFSYFITAYSFMFLWRCIVRLAIRKSKSLKKKVLIIGAGIIAEQIKKTIYENPIYGLDFIGFLDDNLHNSSTKRILGKIKDAHFVSESYKPDHVVITLPSEDHEQISNLVSALHDLPLRVWVVPDFFKLSLHKAMVEEFAGIPMLDLRAPAISDFQRLNKRIFDLAISTIIMPFAIPIMVLIAIAIKLEDAGPVIFKQERVGENGNIFTMYKFRSMIPITKQKFTSNRIAESNGNIVHKTKDDPRITNVGRLLRRASLDELPQLVNVFKGEMSLVGPRPELPKLVDKYQPWQRIRFTVPQGITGWWQINGRSDKPMHLHTQDDLYYVYNYSLLLDFYILAKTCWVVILRKGAY